MSGSYNVSVGNFIPANNSFKINQLNRLPDDRIDSLADITNLHNAGEQFRRIPVSNTYVNAAWRQPGGITFGDEGNYVYACDGNSVWQYTTAVPQSIFCPNTSTSHYFFRTSNICYFTSTFTIEGWMYLTDNGGTPQSLIGQNQSSTVFDIRWFNGSWQISFNSISGTDMGGSLSLNAWTHVACVRTSNNLVKLYINGSNTNAGVTYSSPLGFANSNFGIGCTALTNSNTGVTNYVRGGYTADVVIDNINARYTSNFTPPTTPANQRTSGQFMMAFPYTSIGLLNRSLPVCANLSGGQTSLSVTNSGNTSGGVRFSTFSPYTPNPAFTHTRAVFNSFGLTNVSGLSYQPYNLTEENNNPMNNMVFTDSATSNGAPVVNAYAIAIDTTGTKVFIVDSGNTTWRSNTFGIVEHTSNTPWMVANNTITRIQKFYTNSSVGNVAPKSVNFSNDGTKMVVCFSNTSNNIVASYSLGSAWNVSTASLTSTIDISGNLKANSNGNNVITAATTAHNGLRLFVKGYTETSSKSSVHSFKFETPWEANSLVHISDGVLGEDTTTQGGIAYNEREKVLMFHNAPGSFTSNTKHFFTSTFGNLTIPDYRFFSGLCFSNNGLRAFTLRGQLSGGGANVFSIDLNRPYDVFSNSGGNTFLSNTVSFGGTGTSISNNRIGNISSPLFGMQFKDDGTKLYVGARSASNSSVNGFYNVIELNLSTPYDISTISYSVGSQFTYKTAGADTSGLFRFTINPSGNSIAICYTNSTYLAAQRYDLTVPWQANSAGATANSSWVWSSQTGFNITSRYTPYCFFNKTGTKFYFSAPNVIDNMDSRYEINRGFMVINCTSTPFLLTTTLDNNESAFTTSGGVSYTSMNANSLFRPFINKGDPTDFIVTPNDFVYTIDNDGISPFNGWIERFNFGLD